MVAVLFAGLLLAAGVFYLRGRAFLSTAISADAEVVGLRQYYERTTTRYAQRLQFLVADEIVEAELRTGISYDVGARLVVFYAPGDPTHVTVKPVLYRPVIVLLILAGLVLVGWLFPILTAA